MKKILYVDANVNRKVSRTERLAQALLDRIVGPDDELLTLVLEDERLAPLTGEEVTLRANMCKADDFSDPIFDYAAQFAEMDEIVIAAPYWDFSFPSMLKVYFELLCAQGVTFCYSPEGVPTGLCKAKRMFYVTTAGGYVGEWDYGFDQAKAICQLYFGVPECTCFKAEGLDIVTNDVEAIMNAALEEIRKAEI